MTARTIIDLFANAAIAKKTVIFSTHVMREVEETLRHRGNHSGR